MMDNPFFRSHWTSPSHPRYSPSARGTPVKRQTTSSPKVVSIPVRFVESERTRSASALKIQKVLRGFLVRKSVKKILAIKSKVDEIEQRISRKDTVDLIRRDSKERLKVNETLMALLFKLDSVRGVDTGVRVCRKAVIRRAIALQETLDAIVAGDEALGVVDATDTEVQASEAEDRGDCTGNSDLLNETVDRTVESKDPVDCENTVDQTVDSRGMNKASASLLCDRDCLENAVDPTLVFQDRDESVPHSGESEVIAEASGETEALEMQVSNESINEAPVEPLKLQVLNVCVPESDENAEKMDFVEVAVDSEIKANEEPFIPKENVENQNATTHSASECIEECVETSQTETQSESTVNSQSLIGGGDENASVKREEGMEISQPEKTGRNGGRDDNNRNKELLERMMEDKEKLMGLMTELFVRNEMQTRLLSSLSQRVERLERAFICEKLRRKKKRHAAGTVDGLETSPETKKCGKRE